MKELDCFEAFEIMRAGSRYARRAFAEVAELQPDRQHEQPLRIVRLRAVAGLEQEEQ